MKKVILAKHSGFCFGVENAIKTAIKVVNEENGNVYSLGPLIHNNQVINMLKQKGLKVISSIQEIKNGVVIIRSHGVPLNIIQEAQNKNIKLVDTTCPFVKKIHEKVKEYYKKGYQIVIIGDANHPEVIGINGWCNNSAYIVNSENDVNNIPKCDRICIVAQTTATEHKFEKLSKIIAKKGKEIEIFNTICNATKLRQDACEKVAKNVDAMIIVGGYHSSNTQKLVQISKKFCKNTFHIETVNELPIEKLSTFNTIGITAGASTPDWIIKEVIDKMNSKNFENMNDAMELSEHLIAEINEGDIVSGTVIIINDNEVIVNIGYKSDGIIKKEELSYENIDNPKEVVKVGDIIEVYILKLDDGEGNLVLSKRRADEIKNWEILKEVFNKQEIINAKIIEEVKGGAIAIVKGIRGFIPASHLSVNYVQNINEFIGKNLDVKIIELNKEKKRIILSRKLVEENEINAKINSLWESLEKGKKIEGKVKKITNFGAFVDIGGIDGLIHISELSWGKVNHPSEIVKEGDEVEVIVIDFDREKGRISLSLKQILPHPWEQVVSKYHIGDIVYGTVVKLANFGAFVEIEPGVEGLIHISQMSNEHIIKPSEILKVGQKVKVEIIDIKNEEKRISLSMKETGQEKNNDYFQYIKNQDEGITIGDIINSKEK